MMKDMVETKHTKIGKKSIYRANGSMRLLRALFNYAIGAYENSASLLLFTIQCKELAITRRGTKRKSEAT